MSDPTRKTNATTTDVEEFLGSVVDERRREDAHSAVEIIREVTGADPVMWGGSIIGFGDTSYTTADGKEHTWFAIGLSPRKASLTLYGLSGEGGEDLLERLGPHTSSKGCVYVKRLDALDIDVLRALVKRVWDDATA